MFPTTVNIPEKIGSGSYRHKNGKPCCSVGHFQAAMNLESDDDECFRWRMAFRHAAESLLKIRNIVHHLEYINDCMLTPEERPIVYAAAWGLMGYDLHNCPKSERLVKLVTERYPSRYKDETDV